MTTRVAPAVVVILLMMSGAPSGQIPTQSVIAQPSFETYLDSLRQQAGIPGLSAVLVQDGEIVWERGFGYQNLESRIPATPDTPYPIADISEVIASTLLLQCVEQRRVEIDVPAHTYGIELPEAGATLRHLLSHSSAGIPGEAFKFDPDRYAQVTRAIEACVPQPYRKTVAVLILERLAMKDSVPGRDVREPAIVEQHLFADTVVERYGRVLDRLAVPYKVDKRGRATRTELPTPPDGINTSTGLVSTVRDLAQFDAGLDSLLLLQEDTLAAAWTNVTGADRLPLPMGLGWFVQAYKGKPVVWHFGMVANAYSSLLVKLPSRHLTLILLANSDGLSAPFQLQSGDITKSLFASTFLRFFG